jgi:geranylgeranylglycerol-phosphate geranylgeranyltransferase
MIAAIEILRPVNGLMALAAFVVGAALSGFPLAPIPLQLLIGAIVIFIQSGAGMVLNDYFDWQIDRINRPDRVIPSGRMTLSGSVNYASALFGISIALSLSCRACIRGS